MKQVFGAIVLGFSLAASSASAGSLNDPVVSAPVIVADAENSSSGAAVLTILTLATIIPALQ